MGGAPLKLWFKISDMNQNQNYMCVNFLPAILIAFVLHNHKTEF